VLAPNGSLLLRDYALFDQAQLRFHALPSQGYATIPSLLSAPLDASSTSPANPPVSSPLTTSTETDGDGGERGKPWYRRGDGTMTYFFTVEEVTKLINDACEEQTGGRFEMVGEAVVVEREMNNRAEGWGCTRRFVQGSWKKVEKLDR
jgi:methyltransferase-like protein 6